MARNSSADRSRDGSARKRGKRGAGKDFEQRETTCTRIWNIFASSDTTFDPESDAGSATPSPPPPSVEERAEHQRRIANAVDANKLERDKQNLLEAMKESNDPFNPDIKPTDEEWIKKRAYIVQQLQAENLSVLQVLEGLGITEGSFMALQLLPPPTQNLALDLQIENTEPYKKAMGPRGAFEGTNDNLATKLTMLYFGCPIEPLTLKNVENCEKDQNDPPDDEQEAPRVQRIIYSEKALEFLDSYHERSFGCPMLRRPKAIPLKDNQPGGEIPVRHDGASQPPNRHHHGPHPVQPTGDALHLRGGAGVDSDRYLYSRYGASIKLEAIDDEVSADDFREAALKALDLHPDSAWTIVLDQFDNTGPYKSYAAKPFMRTFVVHSHDFEEAYKSYLNTRVSDRLQKWPLAVDYYHLRMNGEKNIDPLIIPTRSRDGRDILDLTKLPKDRPKNRPDATNVPATQVVGASSTQVTRLVYAYPGIVSQPFDDNAASFTKAIKNLFWSSSPTTVSISLYVKRFDNTTESGEAQLDHTILFPLASNLRSYRDIQERAFQETGWIVVAHQNTTRAPNFWPPSSGAPTAAQKKEPRYLFPKPTSTLAPIYRHNLGYLTTQQSLDFSKQAVKLLGIDPLSSWDFAVDFYSNQPNRVDGVSYALDFSHYVHIRKATLEEQFEEDIQPRLFRSEKDWAAVVRLPEEQPASHFTPFEVLPNPEFEISEDDFQSEPAIRTSSSFPTSPVVSIDLSNPHRRKSQADKSAHVESVPEHHNPLGHDHIDNHGHENWRNGNDRNRNSIDGNGNGRGPPPVDQPPHQPRRIPGAKPPIFRTSEVPKFDKWMLNHTAQNTLQQRSWTQDQSVIEPGYKPAAPLYGDNLELAITVGPSMPTVFTQHLTPTDIIQLRKENRKLLNHALEREIGCPICDTTFKAYDNDAKAAHYKTHMEQISSVGNCPVCNETWALFTWEQKKAHLLTDFAKQASQDIAQFWEDVRCPVCNLDMQGSTAEHVTTHIVSHVPGALKFCDRCGFDVIACTAAERDHHSLVCTRKTAVRESGAPDPVLCESCGGERTPATDKYSDHDACGNGHFCVRDGFNLSFLDFQEQHEHFKRCRVPGGPTGKYCKRCGKDLLSLSTFGLASHNNECYRREPASVAIDENATSGLSAAVEAERRENAAHRTALIRRENELRAQELAVVARERDIMKRERGQYNIDDRLKTFEDLVGDGDSYQFQMDSTNHSSPSMVDHLGTGYKTFTSTPAPGGHHIGDNFNMGICPIPACGFRLGTHSRETVRDHFETHSGLVPPSASAPADITYCHHHGEKTNCLPTCHSDALNASLAEFKRRLPNFREAHAVLQKMVDNTDKSGTENQLKGPRKTAKEMHHDRLETAAISKAENLLGIKRAKEEYTSNIVRDAIRNQASDMIQLRAEHADAVASNTAIVGDLFPDVVIEAWKKVQKSEDTGTKAHTTEEQRSTKAMVDIGLAMAQLSARQAEFGYVGDTSQGNPGDGGGGGGGDGPGDGGGGGGGGGGPPGPPGDDAVYQAGFLPSPTRAPFKKLPTPRRTRSIKGRAPLTGSKRKKTARDDSEDTMSGGMIRSPSKRETKKMRVASQRTGSPEMMRRRLVITEGEEGGTGEAGEAGTGIPRRATRGMSSGPGASAALTVAERSRNTVQEDIEDNGSDKFEDVEEAEE